MPGPGHYQNPDYISRLCELDLISGKTEYHFQSVSKRNEYIDKIQTLDPGTYDQSYNTVSGQLNNKISQNRSKKLTILEQQNPYHTESGPQDTIKTSKVDQHKFFSSIDSESSAGTGTAVYNVITVQRIELEKSEKLRTIKFDNHSGNLPKN